MTICLNRDNLTNLLICEDVLSYSRCIDGKIHNIRISYDTLDEMIEALDSLSSMDDTTFKMTCNLYLSTLEVD